MKRFRVIFAILYFVSTIPVEAAQTSALLPSIPPTFLNASGLVASAAKLCTTATGGSTSLATYSDSTLLTALPNPITLNALGVPQTSGGTSTAIYMQARQYRVTLYAAGTGNTCNGTAVGAQIWQRDPVFEPALLPQFDNVRLCDRFPGATAGAKMAAAVADLPSTGGLLNCTGFEGAQTVSVNPMSGVTKPVTILLGAATFTWTVSLSLADGANGFRLLGARAATQINYSGSNMWIDTDSGTSVISDAEIGNFQVNVASPALGWIRIGRTATDYSDNLHRLRWNVHDIYATGPSCLTSGCTLPAGSVGISFTEMVNYVTSNITNLGFETSAYIDRCSNEVWNNPVFQAYKFGPIITEKAGTGATGGGSSQALFTNPKFLGPTSTGTAGVDYGYTVTVSAQDVTFINAEYEPQTKSQGALNLATVGGGRASSSRFKDINGAFSITGSGTANTLTTITFGTDYNAPQFIGTVLTNPSSAPITFGTPYASSSDSLAIFQTADAHMNALVRTADATNSKAIVLGMRDGTTYDLRAPILEVPGYIRASTNLSGGVPTTGKEISLQYSSGGDQGILTCYDRDASGFKPCFFQGLQIIDAPGGTEINRFDTSGMKLRGGVQSASATPGMQHGRVSTGSCSTSGCGVTLTWGTAFTNTSYTPVCTVVDATALSETTGLRVAAITTVNAGSVVAWVDNPSAGAITAGLDCIAMHD